MQSKTHLTVTDIHCDLSIYTRMYGRTKRATDGRLGANREKELEEIVGDGKRGVRWKEDGEENLNLVNATKRGRSSDIGQ